jgi:hypothetical protein
LISFLLLTLILGLFSSVSLYLAGSLWKNNAKYLKAYPVAGLWPITSVYMVETFTRQPESKTQFLVLPFEIKAKWYPICFLLFWAFSLEYVWDIGVGVIVGYARKFYLGFSNAIDLVLNNSFLNESAERLSSSCWDFLQNVQEKFQGLDVRESKLKNIKSSSLDSIT